MSLPNDPMFGQQWHLRNTTPGLLDLNIVNANGLNSLWDDYTGAGVKVFVIDDAFDYLHEDLAANYDTVFDYDWFNNDGDPFGLNNNSHGTAVMGIIGAVGNNGIGVTGIAYGATMVGYQTAAFINDGWLQDIRDSIYSASANGGDVINISQGIANDANSEFGFGYNALRFAEIDNSINLAVGTGRGGLGTSIVKSAGNSRSDNYDVNSDPWTNNTQQIVVAAVNQNGFVSSYSSFGTANLVSGFGTPGQVVTTDRTGAAGYNATNYTSTFNGSSSAAPMVAGVVTLMVDANAGLGWRDVQDILAYSARHVGSVVDDMTTAGSERTPWHFNQADNWNGGGLHFSNDYGYGLVDAHAAVRLAETWNFFNAARTSANQVMTTEDAIAGAPVVIPDGNLTGTSFTLNEEQAIIVERLTLELDFSTTFLADMDIYLTSPGGVEHVLINDQAGGAAFDGRYTFESQAFRGESSLGDWTVRIVDDSSADVLTVRDVDLNLYGRAATNDDRYIFTGEYSQFAGVAGHRTSFNDLDGGSDVVNAAAVISNSTIQLTGAVSTIDGIELQLFNVEHAIGGDGADYLVGSAGQNTLFGMRGDDLLQGNAGADTLIGGRGSDTVYLISANQGVVVDLFSGVANDGLGLDTLISIENAIGSNFADLLIGSNEDNVLIGMGGADIINGYGGSDTVSFLFTALAVGPFTAQVDLTAQLAYDGVAQDTLFSIENAIGSQFADALFGSAGNNVFNGLGGADLINGLGGIDTISYGGAVAGVFVDLLGGVGDVGSTRDRIYEFENVVGTDFTDLLFGTNGDNIFEGGAGTDFLYGLGGSDTVTLGNAVRGVQIDLTGNVTYDGVSQDFLNSIENAVGSAFNDIIAGSGGNNLLTGGGGDFDVLIGAGGNDRFVYDVAGSGVDLITDFDADPAGGQDLIDLSGRGLTFADIAVNQYGTVTYLTFGGDTVILSGVNAVDITASDFDFV
ncbi:S8 family serine peptidase [Aurantimonas marianensis]|uniref:S8 family serine peptidase n=1 Tax=Aurantimonas marianensis TaxID=2920428 RepID=A0A9X2HDJ8_9HYPH|nr:S8 family serine peptidase [Aurantimonas marianensis]MCP3054989.1 S8 family serine peptidase [Aurantimonas marianensis]